MWVLLDGLILALPTIAAATIFLAIILALFAGLVNTALKNDLQAVPVLGKPVRSPWRCVH